VDWADVWHKKRRPVPEDFVLEELTAARKIVSKI